MNHNYLGLSSANQHLNTRPNVSLILPLFNEGKHVAESVRTVVQILESLQLPYELVLIDDGSKDNTWSELERIKPDFPCMRAIRFSRNFGKEAAMRAGLEKAQGDAVIIMDGDLQHPPSLIPTMVNIWQNGEAQIVEAVKQHRGKESFLSKLRAKTFYKIFSKLAGYNLKGASDFKLMDRKVINSILQLNETNSFFRGISAWVGFNSKQVFFEVQPRAGGDSSWSVLTLARLALVAVTSFSSAPLHLITLVGLIFGFFSILLGIQTFWIKMSGQAVPGYTTVILLLLIIGCSIMTGMGVIGEYIARIYDEVKQRPKFIISESLDSE